MKSTQRRSQRDYTLAFKLAVVDQVEKGEMAYYLSRLGEGILPLLADSSPFHY